MRRALLVSLIFSLAVVADAAACSCVDPVEGYDRAERAFVGTVTEKRADGNEFVYTFRVEKVYKGTFGDTITLRSSKFEPSCGMDIAVGHRTGLALYSGNAETAGLCNLISEQDLERLQKPFPEPVDGGRIALLAPGPFGAAGVVALDARGRLLAYGKGSQPAQISVCPGSRYAIEAAGLHLRVRRLSDMAVTRRMRFPGSTAIRCLDRAGRDVIGFSSKAVGEGPVYRGTLVRLRNGRRTTRTIEGGASADLGARQAVVRTGTLYRCDYQTVDYATGLTRSIGTADGVVAASALSPRERRLGVLTSRIDGVTKLFAIPLDGGPAAERTLPGEISYAALAWQGERRLLVAPPEGPLRRFGATLQPEPSVRPWGMPSIAVLGTRVYGLTFEGVLRDASGTLATLPRGRGGPLVAVTNGPRVGR